MPPPPPPAGDALWLPNTTRPAWLDGSLPGDRGFDPLGLAKPAEYLQVDVSAAAAQGSYWQRDVSRARRAAAGKKIRMHQAAAWRGHASLELQTC